MCISKKDGGKEHPFMKTDKRETKGRERERERETDMCGSSQRKPLEARLLNYTLRSDESERYLDSHCVDQDLSLALC